MFLEYMVLDFQLFPLNSIFILVHFFSEMWYFWVGGADVCEIKRKTNRLNLVYNELVIPLYKIVLEFYWTAILSVDVCNEKCNMISLRNELLFWNPVWNLKLFHNSIQYHNKSTAKKKLQKKIIEFSHWFQVFPFFIQVF